MFLPSGVHGRCDLNLESKGETSNGGFKTSLGGGGGGALGARASPPISRITSGYAVLWTLTFGALEPHEPVSLYPALETTYLTFISNKRPHVTSSTANVSVFTSYPAFF